MNSFIELNNIQKYYGLGKNRLHVLKSLSLEIKHGDFVMIMGKSGSGKTTLLNILGFLDKFDEGEYIFDGKDVTNLTEVERSHFRNKNIGFIFQQFHLINNLNICQNIELPLLYDNKLGKKERLKRVENNLQMVGLLDKIKQFPNELSGGQQQRISIARALINDPQLIFADEPTGALDTNTSNEIMNILSSLNKQGKTIVMVTHDPDLKKYATKVVYLKDGVFIEEG
ncbi:MULTISPECIES: ABC transporter ATP-binding protein [Paraclostridium]|uniref:ABC transporter ATP-binding protein n=1 Tax=Paraclostridium TaxID=1849822 RepID=UPI001CC7ADDC|nr:MULTISPECIES: ABC transporter ATP-binding protein [Paraclostridium]MBZ6007089.1 ABC transporter ATP-binding protein [Paraclostridium bifermentans]MCE9676884.1 ABC transporter ATP-binding protein [Paraclostridium bifermentans]MCR1876888.1 ABC transporter ATP-binding protein [Paraclostridium bifermentans]MDU0295910.1 ABC transporter ATP-binding protein [Paraclostridium sp. MRS3W1]UOW67845.1 ABC transporter ATP-binding protein [Paraclostridium bifermentans]